MDWKPFKHDEICQTTVRRKFNAVCTQFIYPSQIDIWGAAGDEDYLAVTSQTGEPLLKSMSDSGISETDTYIKEKGISAFELFQIQKRRAALRKEHLDYWHSTKASTSTGRPVDAIIAPVAPFPPPPHGKNKHVSIPVLTQLRH
jgi:amidase